MRGESTATWPRSTALLAAATNRSVRGRGGLGNGGGVGVADGSSTLLLVCRAATGIEVPRALTVRSSTVIARTLGNSLVFIFPLSIYQFKRTVALVVF